MLQGLSTLTGASSGSIDLSCFTSTCNYVFLRTSGNKPLQASKVRLAGSSATRAPLELQIRCIYPLSTSLCTLEPSAASISQVALTLKNKKTPPQCRATMKWFSIFLVSLCRLIIPATPLHIPSSHTGNASTASSANHLHVECDTRYGVNLDIQDCRNAIFQFSSGSNLVGVADREHIMPGDDDTLPLPFRIMGSKASPYSLFPPKINELYSLSGHKREFDIWGLMN